LAAGSYSFKAHYGGDGNYVAADSPCEPLAVTSTLILGKTMGFWGNTNGNFRLTTFFSLGGTIPLGNAAAGVSGSRGFTVTSLTESNKIEPKQLNACGLGSPVIFGTLIANCTLSTGLNLGTFNTLAGQTLALSYNTTPSLVPGFSGQTVAGLSTATNNCVALLTSPLTSGPAPLTLTAGSTVNQVLTAANYLIANSASGGSTTQAQAGAMNALLGCVNRETP